MAAAMGIDSTAQSLGARPGSVLASPGIAPDNVRSYTPERLSQIASSPGAPPKLRQQAQAELARLRSNRQTSASHGTGLRSPGTVSHEDRKLARGYGVGYGTRYEQRRPSQQPPRKDMASAMGIDPQAQSATEQRPGRLGALRSPGPLLDRGLTGRSTDPEIKKARQEYVDLMKQGRTAEARKALARHDELMEKLGAGYRPGPPSRAAAYSDGKGGYVPPGRTRGLSSPGTGDDIKSKSISELASMIQGDWGNVNFGAVPYLDAMRSLDSIDDRFGQDSGKSVVSYFLANSGTWRGDTAREVKAELRRRVKESKSGFLSPGIVDKARSVLDNNRLVNMPDGEETNLGKLSTERLEELVGNPNADPALRSLARRVLQRRRSEGGGSPLAVPPVV
jgi:hypothetical protein